MDSKQICTGTLRTVSTKRTKVVPVKKIFEKMIKTILVPVLLYVLLLSTVAFFYDDIFPTYDSSVHSYFERHQKLNRRKNMSMVLVQYVRIYYIITSRKFINLPQFTVQFLNHTAYTKSKLLYIRL